MPMWITAVCLRIRHRLRKPRHVKCLKSEYETGEGYRKQTAAQAVYTHMQNSHLLPSRKPRPACCRRKRHNPEILESCGRFDFGELHFELYQGGGGHLKGESVLIDYENRVVFSGDIL